MSSLVCVERRRDTALLRIVHPPVNALSAAVRAALMEAPAQALADDAVRAVLIAGFGRCFSAGADIAELRDAPVRYRDFVPSLDADEPVMPWRNQP